ncbi:conserved hypothetical protein [Clostridium neonatale]|jgi:hypothetical protein|nr:conserved hypothetical protein [Clostridium neonatale]
MEDIHARMFSYYIDRGFTIEYLENLSYNKRTFFISSMLVNQEEKMQDLLYLR